MVCMDIEVVGKLAKRGALVPMVRIDLETEPGGGGREDICLRVELLPLMLMGDDAGKEVVETLLDFFGLTDLSLTNFLFSDFRSLTSHFNCLTLSPRFSDF